jgi:DNA-binding NarL/FixJ family response regulator
MLDWLRSAMPECLAAGAASLGEAIALPQSESPAIVLVDIADPDADGVGTIRKVGEAMRCAHIVALTMSDDAEYCDNLADAGASASLVIWRAQCDLIPLTRAILTADREGSQRTAMAPII